MVQRSESFFPYLQEIEKHSKAAELQRLQTERFEQDKRGLLQAIGELPAPHEHFTSNMTAQSSRQRVCSLFVFLLLRSN
jgi:hypothetical protein